jgi:hypothetical protein
MHMLLLVGIFFADRVPHGEGSRGDAMGNSWMQQGLEVGHNTNTITVGLFGF